MSKHKHNYTQYSSKPKNDVIEVKMDSAPEVTHADPVGEPCPMGPVGVKPKIVQEAVETKPIPETVTGMVVGCSKLNVRAAADLFADIVCVLDNRSEIVIDVNKSDRDWFYICTATGVEGYCMRKFVEAHL